MTPSVAGEIALLDPVKLYEVRCTSFHLMNQSLSPVCIFEFQKLQASQRRIAELEAEKGLLEAEAQHLKLVAQARVQRATKGGKGAPIVIEVPQFVGGPDAAVKTVSIKVDDIAKYGNHFSIFCYPVITPQHFEEGKNLDKYTWQPHEDHRWANEQNHVLGLTMELYGLLPKKFHPVMLLTGTDHQNSGSFAKRVSYYQTILNILIVKKSCLQFIDAVNGSRSTVLNTLRTHAPVIFNLNAAYFAAGFDRSTVKEIRDLIGCTNYDVKTGECKFGTDLFIPILYKDNDLRNITGRFLNESLLKVRCFL